jgi:hypothetical protein
VFQWCLPRFGDDDEHLFESQAARMRNYTRKRVVEDGFKPRYYTGDKVVIGSHVARFYGACLCRILDAVPLIQVAMTKGALEDLTACLFYSDDWDTEDDSDWDDIYDDAKVDTHPSTATNRLKHG